MASTVHNIIYDKRVQTIYLIVTIFATLHILLFDLILGVKLLALCLLVVLVDWIDKFRAYHTHTNPNN